jgi:sulfur carrier protein ThiS
MHGSLEKFIPCVNVRHSMSAVIVLSGMRHTLEVRPGLTLEAAFRSLDVLPDAHLFLRHGTPVPMTMLLQDGDEIQAVRIASGG